MSTKVTLDHGPNHHLYFEIFERGKVYLTLNGAEFEARPDAVTVAVPMDIWERIRDVSLDARSCWWDEDNSIEVDSPVDPASSQGSHLSTPEEREDAHRR